MSEKEVLKEESSAYDTPMMKQHKELKTKYPDAFLFFRCGDFYEMFANDAIEASKLLNITLTKRQNEIPMCGVPYHAVDFYIKKLVSFGKKNRYLRTARKSQTCKRSSQTGNYGNHHSGNNNKRRPIIKQKQ